MSRPSFNVLTEPWIPVIRPDGTREELGIMPCLLQAHELREIRDPSPIVEFGLYRLLVAFVLDALIHVNRRPKDPLDLKELIKQGRFDSEVLNAYVQKCGDVFDLFGADRPFLQTALCEATEKPVAGAYAVAPSGTNAGHWHHVNENDVQMSVAEGARLLTTFAPFMTAGGAGLSPSINGAPAIYALPTGGSLFESLCLNLPMRQSDSGNGQVAWRNSRVPGEERTEATMAEALTWRPRKVQLTPSEGSNADTVVYKMKFEKGDSTRLTWIDPNLGYRYEKDKVTPIRMREGRPIWREAGPLLLLSQKTAGSGEDKIAFQRPDVVAHAFEAFENAASCKITAYGMRTDMKMKVFEWVRSTLEVPARLGGSTRLGAIVNAELELADRVAFALASSIKHLYPRDGAGNKTALGNLVGRCERAYWQRLEHHFQPLMNAFAALGDDAPDDPDLVKATAMPWREAIERIASSQFENAAKDMDTDSDALERQVKARVRLHSALRKLLS